MSPPPKAQIAAVYGLPAGYRDAAVGLSRRAAAVARLWSWEFPSGSRAAPLWLLAISDAISQLRAWTRLAQDRPLTQRTLMAMIKVPAAERPPLTRCHTFRATGDHGEPMAALLLGLQAAGQSRTALTGSECCQLASAERAMDGRKKGGVISLPMVAINVRVGTRRDGDSWVGWCPSLQVASAGATKALAKTAVKEAVGAWLDSCGGRGVLREALEDAGFVRRSLKGEIAHLLAQPVELNGKSYDFVQVDRDQYVREIDYMHDADSSSVENGFSYQVMSVAA